MSFTPPATNPQSPFDVRPGTETFREQVDRASARQEGRRTAARYVEFLEQRRREGIEQLNNRPRQVLGQTVDGTMIVETNAGDQREATEDEQLSILNQIAAGQDQDPFVIPGGLTAGVPESDFPGLESAQRGFPPPDFTSRAPGRDPAPIRESVPQVVNFRYTTRSAAETLLSMSPSAVLNIQRTMQEAGLIPDITGRVDANTIGAMQEVMGTANVEGVTWQESLSNLRVRAQAAEAESDSGRGTGRLPPQFVVEPFSPPDYDSLAQDVESLFRQRLGRDPEPHELTILADKYRALHRASYDQQVAAAQMKFGQEVSAFEEIEGRDPDDTIPVVREPGTAPEAVDPQATITRVFEDMFGGELDRVDRAREALRNQDTSLGALLAGRSLVNPSAVQEL